MKGIFVHSTFHPEGYVGYGTKTLSTKSTTPKTRNRSSARAAFLNVSSQIRTAVKTMMVNDEHQVLSAESKKAVLDLRQPWSSPKSPKGRLNSGNSVNKMTVFCSKMFKSFDVDGNGTVDKLEFWNGLKNFTPPIDLTKEELGLVFPIFDSDGNGEMSYKEFALMISGDSGSLNGKWLMSKHPDFNQAMESATISQRRLRIKQRSQNLEKPASMALVSLVKIPQVKKNAPMRNSLYKPINTTSKLPRPGRGCSSSMHLRSTV
jgi:hypothetical protein